jgi:uncharacterized protein
MQTQPNIEQQQPVVVAGAKDDRLWGTLAHLSGFIGYVFPMGHLLGPLAVYLFQKDRSAFAASQAKEALNFQISVTIYLVICLILSLAFIGVPMLIALLLFKVICMILAAMRANSGVAYRYPFTLRLVR